MSDNNGAPPAGQGPATEHAAATENAPAVADRRRGFFGHPWGLANLSGIEMWERFSFYGMQALVAYYIYYSVGEGGLGRPEEVGTSIVGAYGGLVYLSAILGAWVSDRLFGAERTLTGAAVLIMIGHLSLALILGMAGVGIGLVCVALGSGALKTTTATVVGGLYRRDDVRRDAAFSLYYMGVNIGAFIGPLLTGAVWTSFGFEWGFGLAAIGMALGLTQYLALRRRTLSGVADVAPDPAPRRVRARAAVLTLGVLALVLVLSVTHVLRLEALATWVTVLTVAAAVVLFAVILTSKTIDATERSRVIAFIPMFLASCAFWSLFQQQFTVVAVLADKHLDRTVAGWEFPASWVQSINPLFIIVFAALFSLMWLKLGTRQPSTPLKFALANLIMGVAFICLAPFTTQATPLLALGGVLFLFTMAELLLSPVGQSLATKLAPQAFQSQMVALFFLSVAIGSSASGALAAYYEPDDAAGARTYFLVVGAAGIVVGVVMVALARPIVRLMRGIR